MKFTLSWLKDHLETDESLKTIVDKLSLIGLEVEGVHNPAEELAAFKVAHVISAEQHPNADKLRVCKVDTGDGTVQVVCGAPNARTGMKGVFAPSGTHIPGTGLDLKPTKIRGVESNGMLVSEREMGLSDEHAGIIEVAEDTPIGTPLADVLGLDDPVIEVAVTPNRPDALGIAGIARDLAAADLGKVVTPEVERIAGEGPCPVSVTLDFPDDEAHLCPAFALRLVRGVRNGPSPAWLRQRLEAIGLRPINALVDITNYITYDRNRPLHVFDANKVKGNLTVRHARAGEELLALDGKTYTFAPGQVVISDDNGVESIGGIMGGEASGCDETTTDVLIESALWDTSTTARTGRTLGVQSDARYRFERGVDPAFCVPGLDMATRMVLDLCGGTASEMVLAGAVPEPVNIIAFDPKEVKRLTGLALSSVEMRSILTRLGFWVAGEGEELRVAVPTWRPDVHEAADLVEEITRIVGVDRVETVPLSRGSAVPKPVLTIRQNRCIMARRTLAARGMVEAVTWSFIPKPHAEAFGGGQPEIALSNPISSEMSDMRPSLLPGLITAAQKNADRGFSDLALFEIGATYHGDRPEHQQEIVAGVRRGTAKAGGAGRHWSGAAEPVDVFDAKADAMAALAALGAPVATAQVQPGGGDWYHPGRSGLITLGPKTVLARFGELHPRTLSALDADGPMVAFEILLDAIPVPKAKPTKARPALDASDLMPVRRDFAFVVDSDVKAGAIVRAARGADKALITGVSVFDVFTGASLGEGRKSVAIEVTLQPRDKTLTDEEIDSVGKAIVAAVEKATGATLR
ncbi:phenylalanine--tRNA ligase subunit beta [Microbaculum marinisediminis]|uniref:Phenylalanine--tRNA ligase beta subunit n=1 Tax=Microbaculum marinisediminis TaxID=2931392 RepID=A0AAW5QUD4_9HYPH|nr:phenylalanine--tRNA ligase subunit beta [Microbaculum sp. A6E488]MCT8970837.1 phenylalanine--tRNA ligase subunit beta [Microbaculum sp. A6E488]